MNRQPTDRSGRGFYPIGGEISHADRTVNSYQTAYDRVLDQLLRYDRAINESIPGQKAMAQCPSHADATPSLSVRAFPTRARVHCFAGCEDVDVLAALGLGVGDLFNDAVTRYRYPDRVVIRSYDANGRHFKQEPRGISGPTSLYRPDRVRAAIAAGDPVFVVEGEEDCHTLDTEGVTATTAPNGANSFGKADVSPLQNADVIAVVDHDKGGQQWARSVADMLAGTVKSIQFVRAKTGKDATDHIMAGHGLNELINITDSVTSGTMQDVEHGDNHDSDPVVITLADVTTEPIEWLWHNRFPAGKVVTVDGDPGTAKSTLMVDCAAHVTTGHVWPDGAPCPLGGFVIMSAEDGLADTITPRAIAAGADLSRFHALTEIRIRSDDGQVKVVPPSLPRDIDLLESVIKKHHVRLVVIDVLMAYLAGRVDSHRDQDVRLVLHQLSAMAERTGATIVLIRHLNKSGGGNAMYRGGGSIGIVGAARAGFLVAKDPDNPERRIFALIKSNLAPDPPALAFRLVDTGSGVAQIEWEPGAVEYTAGELLRNGDGGEDADDRREIYHWLIDYLSEDGGAANAADVIRDGKKAGFSVDAIKKARKGIRAKTERKGFGKGASYVWSVDPIGAMGAMDAHSQEPASMAPMRHPCGDESGANDDADLPDGDAEIRSAPALVAQVKLSDPELSGLSGEPGTQDLPHRCTADHDPARCALHNCTVFQACVLIQRSTSGRDAPLLCRICGEPISSTQVEQGYSAHPTCDPAEVAHV